MQVMPAPAPAPGWWSRGGVSTSFAEGGAWGARFSRTPNAGGGQALDEGPPRGHVAQHGLAHLARLAVPTSVFQPEGGGGGMHSLAAACFRSQLPVLLTRLQGGGDVSLRAWLLSPFVLFT